MQGLFWNSLFGSAFCDLFSDLSVGLFEFLECLERGLALLKYYVLLVNSIKKLYQILDLMSRSIFRKSLIKGTILGYE